MKPVLACICGLVLVGSASWAEEPPLITDRPDQSIAPSLLPRGLFQIEGGGTLGQRDHENEQLDLKRFPSALLRFGLTDSFELRLGVPGFGIEVTDTTTGQTREDGLIDATLGFKLKIVEQKGAVPNATFVGTLVIPSGDDEFTSDRVDPSFVFAFSNTLSEMVTLTYNVGVLWTTTDDASNMLDTRSFFNWTLTAGFAFSDAKLGAFAELFGLTGISGEGAPLTSAGGGVTYLVTPRIQVDGRVTVGLSSVALDWTAGVGVSYRFPRFKG